MKKILIDGDIMLYRIAESHQENVPLNELVGEQSLKDSIFNRSLCNDDLSDIVVAWGNIDDVGFAIDEYISNLKKKLKADYAIVCLSDSKNFRKSVKDSYKGNRTKAKPVTYAGGLQTVKKLYDHVVYPALEADDVLGILATDPNNTDEIVIVSDDKDLEQIPVQVYKPMSDTFVNVTKESGRRKFFEQVLAGDRTDGYAGCPGIGDKTANKILDEEESFERVLEEFVAKGLTLQDMTDTVNMARILQFGDYDFSTVSVNLWVPNNELKEKYKWMITK
jgi:DNA polymerase-1